ncbi:MAG TPA: cyclopropane-fatty-acyl-phospholipid synthase family protein [Ktedonobacterales bacterium]|nr:cyclopropane-fatty-acyl-phospholipid synthase family protein [Ktedonobacterales bacterium]
MATTSAKANDHAMQASLAVLKDVLGDYHPRAFAVRLWDGAMWESEANQPAQFTLVLKHPGALRRMFLPPSEMNLSEAYIYDDFDIEGDILAVFPVADYLFGKSWGKMEQLRLGQRLLSLPREDKHKGEDGTSRLRGARHSKSRDQQAISYHYDRSNDFYALWLDQRMVYSCAYFHTPEDSLDAAQEQKLDYICRKLRLKPGEQVLDIGCGWGGLVIYAAQHYGVSVDGITLSTRQAELARERIHAAGLEDRCRVLVQDYREVNTPDSYDKLVSVGMFEHVGEAMLPIYFRQAWKILKPGGAFLNHGIASTSANANQRRDHSFVFRYVFPDGELVRISTTLHAAEDSGFEVRDVESLREHYALTLRHWVRNLEAHAGEARRLTDDVTYRIWRLYISGSVYSFEQRVNNIYQTLLVKPDHGHGNLPLTRDDWYV